MHKPRAGLPWLVLSPPPELLEDFDQIEEATEECVRLVQHGHTFDGSIQGIKPAHSKIYSL